MNPATEMLRRLRRLGFVPQRILDAGGAFSALYYVRAVHQVHEVVLVWTEDEALAYRSTDMFDEHNPLAQPVAGTLLWRYVGDVVTVVHALLSLPAPHPPAPFLHGPQPPIWTPPDGPR